MTSLVINGERCERRCALRSVRRGGGDDEYGRGATGCAARRAAQRAAGGGGGDGHEGSGWTWFLEGRQSVGYARVMFGCARGRICAGCGSVGIGLGRVLFTYATCQRFLLLRSACGNGRF